MVSGHRVPSLGVEPFFRDQSRSRFCLLLPGKEGWGTDLVSKELYLAWGALWWLISCHHSQALAGTPEHPQAPSLT